MRDLAIVIEGADLLCSGGASLDHAWQALMTGENCLGYYDQRRQYRYGGLPKGALDELRVLLQERVGLDQDYAALMPLLLGRRLLNGQELDRDRCLTIIGSSRGLSQKLTDSYQNFFSGQRLSAKTSPQTTAGTMASLVARNLKLKGLNFTVSAACSSSLHAVGVASMLLRSGLAEYALAGGSEYAANQFSFEMLKSARVFCRSMHQAYPHRPFASDRSGMVLGSGAAMVLLKAKNRSQLSSGDIEILAYQGSSEDAGLTGVSSCGQGLQEAMASCLNQAGLEPEAVDTIVTHGASTVKGDAAELQAYRQVFGPKLPLLQAHKWVSGHTLGAAGAVALSFAWQHLRLQKVHSHPYASELDDYNSGHTGVKTFRHCLVVSMGFGGNQAVALLRRNA